MQIETYIIVAGLLLGWIATAFFLIRASKKAFARGFDRGVNLAREPHTASPACTFDYNELLTKITTSLELAVETWQALPGTEILVARVNKQRCRLIAFNAKMALVTCSAPINSEE